MKKIMLKTMLPAMLLPVTFSSAHLPEDPLDAVKQFKPDDKNLKAYIFT